MTKPIITVIGATGSQGGSVVSIFLSDPALKDKWQVRAVTRDPTKEAAKQLAARGCEVVAADLEDKASLVKALQGSHTVYGVTDYWSKMDMKLEVQLGKNLADAVKEVAAKHYIWSTLPDVNKISNGELPHVYHFDGKASVDEYIKSLGIPASFYQAGFYMSNITSGMLFRRDPAPDGGFAFIMPTAASSKVPLVDPHRDTGKFIRGIVLGLEDGSFKQGGVVRGAGAYYTLQEVVDTFAKVYPEEGKRARFVEVTPEQYIANRQAEGFPEYVALEVTENMRLLGMQGYYGGVSLDESVKLAGGSLTTLEEHMRNVEAWKELK